MKNQKLQAARKTRRWSSEVAAEKIGISPITYSRWENGKQTPYLSTLDQLCRVFQQSPEELGFLPDGSKDPGTTTVLWETQAGQAVSHPVLSTGEAFRLAMMGLILAQRQNHWTLEELRLQIERELGTINDMNQPSQPDVSRREVLAFLAGLPLALYGLTTTERKPSPLASEDLLPLYAASIPACG